MSSPGAYLTDRDVAARLGVSVKTLTRILARVPSTLPGAPLAVHGDGGKSGRHRCRRRWNPATVDAWIEAVARVSAPAKPEPRPESPRRRSGGSERPLRMIDRVRQRTAAEP